MKPQLQLHIPKPCHEDWNQMTPVDKGKFCASCNKQVVDFSLMSDRQVLNYFSTATGKTCGRFAEDQLQRDLVPTKIEKKKAWWIAMMMPLLLLFDKTNAQKKNINTTQGNSSTIKQEPRPQLMGKVAAPVAADTMILMGGAAVQQICTRTVGDTILAVQNQIAPKGILITGRLTDNENSEAIPYATVSIKGEKTATVSDSAGNFKLTAVPKEKNASLIISSVGYEQKEITIPLNNDSNNITLQQEVNALPEVIVVNEKLTICTRMSNGEVVIVAGYTIAHRRVKQVDTIPAAIRKVFRNEAFKAYPNPAPKGSLLHVEIKKAGNYSIQLLDNNSNILLVEEFVAESNNAATSINIPSTLAPGIYYIRVIDEHKRKPYVDKIMIR